MRSVDRCRPLRHSLRKIVFVLLLLRVLSPNAEAQFTRFQNYNNAQGLADLTVTALAQDRDGYMLLGTQGGLFRYDGASIAAYDAVVGLPPAAWISEITTDVEGRVWVVSTDGIFVRQKAVFKKVDVGNAVFDPSVSHLLAAIENAVYLVLNGRLFQAGVSGDAVGPFHPVFGASDLTQYPALNDLRFVTPDARGGLLIGCGSAICRLADKHLTITGVSQGLPADRWQIALQTPDGTLWARSLDHLAWRRSGQTSFQIVDVPGQRSSFFAGHPEELALISDQHGGILTQRDQGIIGWNGAAWRSYPRHEGGLSASVIEALTFDREGSLWLGSAGYGAYRSQGMGIWEHWTIEDGLPDNNAWALRRTDDGRFWVSTYNGTAALGTHLPVIPGTDYVMAESHRGKLWLAPSGAPLERLDRASGTVERFASVGNVLTAAIDRDNRLWLCTRTKLFVIDDADAAASRINAVFVLSLGRMSVMVDQTRNAWLLSRQGVFRRNPAGRFDLIVPPGLLKGQPMAATLAPDGDLWIATEQEGVDRFHLNGKDLQPLTPVRSPELSSDATLSLSLDHRGWVWVGTDRGIDVWNGTSWRRFDSSDGTISNDLDEYSAYEDTDGSMWFGTSHGLSHLIDPSHLPPPKTLHPRITQLTLGARDLAPNSSITVPWDNAPLIIHFADLDFDTGPVSFRYRLQGLDTVWSETTGRDVRYAHVPAGKFQFELVATSGTHDAVAKAVGFTLHIRAPWWQRWWFYALCAIAGAQIVFCAWQARVRLLLQHKRRLEAVVTARTAEIEAARAELQRKSLEEQERLAGEQRRLEDMVQLRTLEIEQARRELERLAMSDALTGLPNRRAIMELLETAVAEAHRARTKLAVLICDLDRFKQINDGFGHLAGDAVLSTFGARLADAIVTPEVAGRYGGEEFLMILRGEPDLTRRRVAAIQASLTGEPFQFGGADRPVTLSGGLAFLRPGDTAVTLVGRADAALYEAKSGGRNRIKEERDVGRVVAGCREFASVTSSASLPGLGGSSYDMEHELRLALANNQFELHYQPVVNIEDGTVTSCEALIRWTSAAQGNVSPGVFIPVAEQVGLMPELGDWVLGAACREAASWPDQLRVSVNLSPLQLCLPDLKDRVAAALRETGLRPGRLELEVTETAMIDDIGAAKSMLRQLKALGVTIALDDFGTGYSSLGFLRVLPFDRIKIDKSFVHDLGSKPEAASIVQAMTGLCGSLGRAITGEGAESPRQIELLRDVGCREVQGFQICRPKTAVDLRQWLVSFATTRGAAYKRNVSMLVE